MKLVPIKATSVEFFIDLHWETENFDLVVFKRYYVNQYTSYIVTQRKQPTKNLAKILSLANKNNNNNNNNNSKMFLVCLYVRDFPGERSM